MVFRLVVLLALFASASQAQTLLGRAVLPADTFIPGPTSGTQIESANGVSVPFENKQVVGGFSSLQHAENGDFWALSDNGFGAKANSSDFLLRVHRLGRDFQTAKGGSGKLFVKETIYLRDPNKKAGFPIVNENTTERRLTGADFDPESLVVAPDGSWWIGEEFGPFLLNFSKDGVLIKRTSLYISPLFKFYDSNLPTANIASPDDPLKRSPNLGRSKGFEGLALASDNETLFALLEGPVEGDPPQRLRIYEYDMGKRFWSLRIDLETNKWRSFSYRLEHENHAIGELSRLPNGKHLVIERDGLQGDAAKFKKIYEVDFNDTDQDGFLIKRERADLLNIADPNGISGAPTFRFPFQTIESVLPLDNDRVVVMNDNNYPFSSGRGEGEVEDTEAIVIRLKQ